MGITFTTDQQRVIDARNKNILVSAAAGSGKTAVLVERIIKMITDEEHPVDIDRLLIVTFTSAAAAQMRERISRAVAKKLEEHPESDHLQRQSTLIHNAQITTIDSFCLYIIRNNFNSIGLDPSFRVADESEIRMIEADVLDRLLEEAHSAPTEIFLNLVESYSTGIEEKNIEDAILGLYHFSMSYPFPEQWLEDRRGDYLASDSSDLASKGWFRYALSYVRTVMTECDNRLQQALSICGKAGGSSQYMETIISDIELVGRFLDAGTYEELHDLFEYLSFARLPGKKVDGVEPSMKEMVKAIREGVKKEITGLGEMLFRLSSDDVMDDLSACRRNVDELISLTLMFKSMFDKEKRDRNIIDFSDMEHFALQILLDTDDGGNASPSAVALELKDYFEEVMVDEYQDSNDVQELLLECVSGGRRRNRFMVGDVKQSIYKFRLARPEIFMEKYNSYPVDDPVSGNIRIDLSMNFRSRREVTDSANFICGQLMSSKVGNVEYDDAAALHVGSSYGTGNEGNYDTEIIIAGPCSFENDGTLDEESGDPEFTAKEAEALMVADRISKMVGTLLVTDPDTGLTRPAKYSDIVILFRATAGWDEDFRKILSDRGIPVHVTSRTGYFETLEIQGIVNFLKIIDNPLQDVPLFGTLKLPYFGFAEADITAVKCFAEQYLKRTEEDGGVPEKQFLYNQLKLFYHKVYIDILSDTDSETVRGLVDEMGLVDAGVPKYASPEKIKRFLSCVDRYRKMVSYVPVREPLEQIISDMSYDAYVGSMPGGEQRTANIALLLEKADMFQETSFSGLFHFIRYLETMKDREVDFGEANILDEGSDAVRIMTIHKSKGLEFPVCFVCGLSKKFNMMDMRQGIVTDAELGIGVDFVDPDMRVRRRTMRKNVVIHHMKEDSRGEDLRVLYVALTRAKEKLILTGYVDDLVKKFSDYAYLTLEDLDKLPYSVVMGASSYMDMVIASVIRHPCADGVLDEAGYSRPAYRPSYSDVGIRLVKYRDGGTTEAVKRMTLNRGKAIMLDEILEAGNTEHGTMMEALREKLSYEYPHTELSGLSVKTTVSELKTASHGGEDDGSSELINITVENYVPRFAREGFDRKDGWVPTEARSGVQYGTAVHKVMELLSFSEALRMTGAGNEKSVRAELNRERERWISDGIVTEDQISCVGIGKIMGFLRSGLAGRMISANLAGTLLREKPFTIGLNADVLDPKFPPDETVLIQGVIDAFFEDADGIVLVDYKTDQVENGAELAEKYGTQLDYYQKAIERVTGKKVSERYLYSFSLQEAVRA